MGHSVLCCENVLKVASNQVMSVFVDTLSDPPEGNNVDCETFFKDVILTDELCPQADSANTTDR